MSEQCGSSWAEGPLERSESVPLLTQRLGAPAKKGEAESGQEGHWQFGLIQGDTLTRYTVDRSNSLKKTTAIIKLSACVGLSFVLWCLNGNKIDSFTHVTESKTTDTLLRSPSSAISDKKDHSKKCSVCHEIKDLGDFASKGIGQKRSWCKSCDGTKRRIRYVGQSTSQTTTQTQTKLSTDYEFGTTDSTDLIPTLLGLMSDQGLLNVEMNKDGGLNLDKLLDRKNKLEHII